MAMRAVRLSKDFFQGAVSVEAGQGWLKPWRLPVSQLGLFPSPGEALQDRAAHASGVRLRMETDARALRLDFEPLGACGTSWGHALDLTIEGERVATAAAPPGTQTVTFGELPAGRRVVEIWLPQSGPVRVRGLRVEGGRTCRPAEDGRRKWVTYGSSLTHCVRAHSPARTWPAIVARRMSLHLTCLGYGGQCHLDPMAAMMIRDMPADVITLKLGINTIAGTLNARTFRPAVIGLVRIIREKHPRTPIGLITPIAYPPHETKPNVVGMTIEQMRSDIEDAWKRLCAAGDGHLHLFSGLDIFDAELIARHSTDQCHPGPEGIEVMAERFLDTVMTSGGLWRRGQPQRTMKIVP